MSFFFGMLFLYGGPLFYSFAQLGQFVCIWWGVFFMGLVSSSPPFCYLMNKLASQPKKKKKWTFPFLAQINLDSFLG